MTSVNLQGKNGCEFVIGYYYSLKPKRAKYADGFPSTPEENMERLKDAGTTMQSLLPYCYNCQGE